MKCWKAFFILAVGIGMSAFLLLHSIVWAAETYPSRPIQIIVPFPPGGVADLVARPFAASLEKILKQPVVVVNKTGAGGAVGMQAAAVSKPDGYNLMVALANSLPASQLAEKAYSLYEKFRPEIPPGKKGWGVSGKLALDLIRKMASA